MDEPLCPKCNSPMVLRTARKGPNAGNKFYGCSRYPRCKSTLPLEHVSQGSSEHDEASVEPSHRNPLPRNLIARSKIQGYQVRFFESVAVSTEFLEIILDEEIVPELKRAFSQWRIDFPAQTDEVISLTERERQVLAIAEKILTRGRITLCSPLIEHQLSKKFRNPQDDIESINLSNLILTNENRPNISNFWLDSPAERLFYEKYLPDVFVKNYKRWVLPQIEISSLLPPAFETTINGRVDFLICHPRLEPIIVEIEGEEHKKHHSADLQRDLTLSKHGYKVIRIPASAMDSFEGEELAHLKAELETIQNDSHENTQGEKRFLKFIAAVKIVHQLQLTLLTAIQSGFLNQSEYNSWHISTDIDSIGLFNKKEAIDPLNLSVNDLIELLQNLCSLYSTNLEVGSANYSGDNIKPKNTIHISFDGKEQSSSVTFYLQELHVPFHISYSVVSTVAAILDKPKKETLEYFLNYIFRKPSFWEGQFDAISRTLEGKDSIILLPTGAGKSIAFQLASFLLPGRTVVIDPIISLMEDQIDNLQATGIDRCIAITGQITDPEEKSRVITLFGQGEYLFAYIAPERFQTIEFRDSLRSLTVHTPISLIAVDEAHCVSEWGHDFRTSYLNIGRISRIYSESNGHIPPLLALTGTASRAVLKDVQRELQIEDFEAIITPKSFDRPELKFHIIHSSSHEKSARLVGLLGQMLPSIFSVSPSFFYQQKGKSTHSGLVFCPHVNGDFGVVAQADTIREKLSVNTASYSGKEPKFFPKNKWPAVKRETANKFKHNRIPILVCTKAFGMGIDKPNIRYTVHFGIPSSIESFYQEAGRAGRDRKTAHCFILASDDHPERTRKLLDPNTPAEEVFNIIKNRSREEDDDITRALYFQSNAFPGISVKRDRISKLLGQIEDVSKKGKKILTFPTADRATVEKCIHRLLTIGIIKDYTINYSSNEFVIEFSGKDKKDIIKSYGKYIAGYLGSRSLVEVEKANKFLSLQFNQFVIEIINLLLNFIYEVIERGRRRALTEMLLAASSVSDKAIRLRILRHLEATEYSESLEKIISDSKAGIVELREIFEKVRSPNKAGELRGQVARYLESYPDHPGLLMLRGLAEIYARDKDQDIAQQNFLASISSASENYGIKEALLFDFIVWSITQISTRNKALAEKLQFIMLLKYPERLLARDFLRQLPQKVIGIPGSFLMNRLMDNVQNIITM